MFSIYLNVSDIDWFSLYKKQKLLSLSVFRKIQTCCKKKRDHILLLAT